MYSHGHRDKMDRRKRKEYCIRPSKFSTTEWSKKVITVFKFCDNFRKCTQILTILSLLEQEIYGA